MTTPALTKTCSSCPEGVGPKPLSEFYKHSSAPDGLRSTCKDCHRKQNRDRYRRKTAAQKAERSLEVADARFRRLYGISSAERKQWAEQQGNRCGICKAEASLVTDHCHERDTLRGLLCDPCNLILGLAKDDPVRLRAAADYLSAIEDAHDILDRLPEGPTGEYAVLRIQEEVS